VNGWRVGDESQNEDLAAQDDLDRRALASTLEEEVLPTWQAGRERWEPMMRKSIEMAQWKFSSYRMLEDYYREVYRA
jgi:glucan phosphorylase